MITNELIAAVAHVVLGMALLLIGTAVGYLIRDEREDE